MDDNEEDDHSIWDFREALTMYRGAEIRPSGFSGRTRDSQWKQCIACLLCYGRFIFDCLTNKAERKTSPKESV